MITGTFIWAKCLLANTMALNCLLPNCAFSHFNSMAIHHGFCVAYVSRVVVIYYLTRNYCADFAIWLKRKHPSETLERETEKTYIFPVACLHNLMQLFNKTYLTEILFHV